MAKKSPDPNSPYSKIFQNMGSSLGKMLENGPAPELVAKTVLDAVMDKSPKLRYPAGNDVKQWLERKKNMSDEDFFDMMKQDL